MLEVPVSGFWSELDDPAPLDWLVVVDCEVEELGLVRVDCCSALAPLVTLCEPLPMFTPGLTSAPMFAFELLTPTFASTPTFGFTLRLRVPDDVLSVPLDDVPDALGLEDDLLLEAPEVPELSEVPELVVPLAEPDD